jgi:hypothetical protein
LIGDIPHRYPNDTWKIDLSERLSRKIWKNSNFGQVVPETYQVLTQNNKQTAKKSDDSINPRGHP